MDKRTPYARRIPDSHEIPPDLLELPIWLAWRLVHRPGEKKPGKVPVSPITGRETGWTDPANQGTFEQARDFAEANGCTGVGIALTPRCGLAGGDLDGCRNPDTGELSEAATGILAAANTYTEISPGLAGIRFFARGSFGGYAGTDNKIGVELYDGSGGARFLTVTADYLDQYPFAIEKRDLSEIGRKYFPHKGEASDSPKVSGEFHSVDIANLDIGDHAREAITTGEIGAYPGGNEAVFGLAKDLIRAGLSVDDAARVLADPDNGISAVAYRRRGANPASAMDWLLNQVVMKAAREVAEEPPLIQFPFNQQADDEFVDVSIADVFERPEPPHSFIWSQRIPAYAATLLSADGGTGKSGGALQLAACVALGADFLGQPVIQRNALFFSAEDHGSVIRRRFHALCRNMNWHAREVAQSLRVIDAIDSALLWEQDARTKRAIPTANYERLRRYCEEHAIGFLVIDNASDTFGADRWDKSQVTQFIRALTALVLEQDGAVLTLAHVNRSTAAGARSNQNDYADSVAWHNAVRSRLFLSEEKHSGVLTLEHQKSNYDAKGEPLKIERMEGIGWRLADSATPEYAAGQALIRATQQKVLLAMVADYYRRGEWASTSANSPGTNPHSLFNREPGFPSTLKKADTLALFREMERAGFIEREAYAKPNRHPAERWRLTDKGREFAQLPAGEQADGQDIASTAPGASGSVNFEPDALSANPSANALGCAPAQGGIRGASAPDAPDAKKKNFSPGDYLYLNSDDGKDGAHVFWHHVDRRRIERVTAKTVFLGPCERLTWPCHTPPVVENWKPFDDEPERFMVRNYHPEMGVKLGLASYGWKLEKPGIPSGPPESVAELRARKAAGLEAWAKELRRTGREPDPSYQQWPDQYAKAIIEYRANLETGLA